MIKVYIANLGKYSEGYHVGKWLELPASEEEMQELFAAIKLGYFDEDGEYVPGYIDKYGNVYEEYAIHDYECDIDGVKISEYSNLKNLNELAEELDGLNSGEIEELNLIHECLGTYDINKCLEILRNREYSIFNGISNETCLGVAYIDEVYGGIEQLGIDTIREFIDTRQLGLYLTTSCEWFSNGYYDFHSKMSDEETGEFFLEEFGVDGLPIDELKYSFDYEQYAKENLHDFTIIGNQAISIHN